MWTLTGKGRFDLQINKYLTTHVDINLIYDNDILIGKDDNENGKIEEKEKKTKSTTEKQHRNRFYI